MRNQLSLIALGCAALLSAVDGPCQIGGHVAADGPFTLDDVEDLDLFADGVGRDWISDYVWPSGYVLSVEQLSGSGLTLATGQSPIGALQLSIPSSYGYIDAGFGVPMPAVVGASTLDAPGDITSFEKITFLARCDSDLPDLTFLVILETYPGPDYPKIYWAFTPTVGTTFQTVELTLRAPSQIEGGTGLTLEQLLAQTRYLAIHVFSGYTAIPQTLELHVDDIRLVGEHQPPGEGAQGLTLR